MCKLLKQKTISPQQPTKTTQLSTTEGIPPFTYPVFPAKGKVDKSASHPSRQKTWKPDSPTPNIYLPKNEET